jgi:hypothetical protein
MKLLPKHTINKLNAEHADSLTQPYDRHFEPTEPG